jgi:hypothetical protein
LQTLFELKLTLFEENSRAFGAVFPHVGHNNHCALFGQFLANGSANTAAAA